MWIPLSLEGLTTYLKLVFLKFSNYIRWGIFVIFVPRAEFLNLMLLCLVGMNDSGRNGMENELFYGQFLKNFILSSIPFLTSCMLDITSSI